MTIVCTYICAHVITMWSLYVHVITIDHTPSQHQYIFIHDTLLEVIRAGNTQTSLHRLQEKYRELQDLSKQPCDIVQEFEVMEISCMVYVVHQGHTLPWQLCGTPCIAMTLHSLITSTHHTHIATPTNITSSFCCHFQRVQELQVVKPTQFTSAKLPPNTPKNRNTAALPCELQHNKLMGVALVTWWVCPSPDDLHRVRLLMQPGVTGSDYINATFVDVSKGVLNLK